MYLSNSYSTDTYITKASVVSILIAIDSRIDMILPLIINFLYSGSRASLVAQQARIPLQCRRHKSIYGSRGSPGEGYGNPLPVLENPMDRGAWHAVVHGVARSQIRLKWLSTHAQGYFNQASMIIILGLMAYMIAFSFHFNIKYMSLKYLP